MEYREAKKLVRKCRRIRGYTAPEAIYLFAMLDEIQKQNNISGGLFEIGIAFGRVLTALCTLRVNEEWLGCCEFEKQNVDASMAALRRFCTEPTATAHNKSSLDLEQTDFNTPCRLIHIDGLHTAEAVRSDLDTCALAMMDEGLIVMDDVFNESYPGVVDALAHFLIARPEFCAVVQGFGKTVLAKKDRAPMYRSWFSEGNWRNYLRRANIPTYDNEFFGHATFVFKRSHLRMAFYRMFAGYLF